jgi:hypothetical protein
MRAPPRRWETGPVAEADCGGSSRFDDHPVDLGRFIAAVSGGDLPAARAMIPYSLQDRWPSATLAGC